MNKKRLEAIVNEKIKFTKFLCGISFFVLFCLMILSLSFDMHASAFIFLVSLIVPFKVVDNVRKNIIAHEKALESIARRLKRVKKSDLKLAEELRTMFFKNPKCSICNKDFIKESEHVWAPGCKCFKKNIKLCVAKKKDI